MNAQRLLRRALRARSEAAPSSELNVVPFLDILTNIVLFLLATTSAVMVVSQVRAELPGFGPGRGEPLQLSLTLTDRGAFMSTRTSHVGPDCRESSVASPTAAVAQDGYDFAALTACARRLHDAHPEDTTVILSADPQVPYQHFVGAMDALRADGDVVMFPDVRVSAGVL